MATSFKPNAEQMAAAENTLTRFENPVYDLHDKGLASTYSTETGGSDPESEQMEENLSMIGKSLYEDDIEL